MLNEYRAVAPLRIFLALLFLVLIPFEVFSLPGQFAHLAAESPEQAYLRWPATVVSIFWVVCVQVVVVCTWRLLGLVQGDRIFSPDALRWVDAILAAIGAAWLVLGVVLVLVGLHADDPGPIVLLFLLAVGVTVLGLLMVVMRALLRQATALRRDLEAVI
jgi:hypothetical protein